LDWIRRRGGECTARDLVRAKKITPTTRAKLFLKDLEDRGFGKIESRVGANHKAVERFILSAV
jgi:uncharacterized membrane protein